MAMDQRDVDATIDLVHQAAMNNVDQDLREDEEWKGHPLFRSDLPDDVDQDKYLSCFQYVLYDGETDESLAVHYKDLGNELYRNGKQTWRPAYKWWSKGIELKPKDLKLRSILHSNRATVSLGFQEYQKAAVDADWAIKYDHMNKKAYLRAAHAYQGMGDWDKAIGAARAGLEIVEQADPLFKPLTEVVEKVESELKTHESRINRYFTSLQACSSYLVKRGFSVGHFAAQWQGNWELYLRFDEESNQTLWPIAVCYEEVLHIDFVEAYSENTPLTELIQMMFPEKIDDPKVPAPPWDYDTRYRVDTVAFYVKTFEVIGEWGRKDPSSGKSDQVRESEAIEVDSRCGLAAIFKQPNYIIPGYPILYVAVRDSDFFRSLNISKKIMSNGTVQAQA